MEGEVEGGGEIREIEVIPPNNQEVNDIANNLVTGMDTNEKIPPANPQEVIVLRSEMRRSEQFVPANNLAVLQIGNGLLTEMDVIEQFLPANTKEDNVVLSESEQVVPAYNVLLSESEQILALNNEVMLKMATGLMRDMQ